jgi:hypothetical protein
METTEDRVRFAIKRINELYTTASGFEMQRSQVSLVTKMYMNFRDDEICVTCYERDKQKNQIKDTMF